MLVVPVVYLSTSQELKTKPAQHAVEKLRSIGIMPDVLICRSDRSLNKEIKNKISLFCNVPADCIIQNMNSSSIYKVPLILKKEGLLDSVCKTLNIDCSQLNISEWEQLVKRESNIKEKITIALVGKYVELHDAYLSIMESLKHAGIHNDVKVEIEWINSEDITEDNYNEKLALTSNSQKINGILVPGGFGNRGCLGKILAIKYARENKVPFLGICLGMQLAVIEFAQNVCQLKDVNSTEFDEECLNPVIHIMENQKQIYKKGQTMRLGSYECNILENTLAYNTYKQYNINERHRHRYEFNNYYRDMLSKAGLVISGLSPDGELVEIIELYNHPYFIACQFHPEFKSSLKNPHPLFDKLVFYSKKNI